MTDVLAVIPARGGSKGIPHKNIVPLNGKPLIAWTILAAIGSSFITKTVVSSDDDEILRVAEEYGAEPIRRPAELATDAAPSEPVITHALNTIEQQGFHFDYVILLQPTSPLRNARDVDQAFSDLFDFGATALISVCVLDNKILKAFRERGDGFLDGISNNIYPFMRRQDLPKTYMSNGAIYIIRSDLFLKYQSLMTNKTIAFEMCKEKSTDIDSMKDLEKAAILLDKQDCLNIEYYEHK